MATEDDIKRAKELNEQLEQTNQLLAQKANLIGNVSSAFDESLDSLGQIKALHVAIKDDVASTEGLSTSQIEKQQEFIDILLQRIDLEERAGNISSEEAESRRNSLSETSKQVDYMKEKDEIATNELNTVLKKDQNLIGITQKFKNISSIGEKRLSTEELINARMQYGQMVISAIVDKVAELAGKILDFAMEVDNASRELMRTATFTYEEASKGLINITAAAAGSGLSISEAGKAMVTLKEDFSAFTTLTEEGRTKVGAMVGVLDKMGVSSETSAKFLDMSTKSLGMSMNQSLGFLSSLKGFADASGVSLQRLSKDLAANADNIANFGQQGIQTFKEMELAAKQLGIAMGELYAITEKYTTFEGAAAAAGQLNAVLGGDFLNSVDLLTASLESPTDVFKQFKQAMDLSGRSFDDLDNGMKRVAASAMGMSVQQAGRIMSMDLNTATAAMREQEQTQETLNEMSNKMLNIMDKLKTAFAALYPAIEPILDILADFADMFTTFATGFAKFIKENDYLLIVFKGLALVIGAVGLALGVLGTVILPVYAQIMTFKLVVGNLKNGLGLLKGSFSGLTGAIKKSGAAMSGLITKGKALIASFFKIGAAGPVAGGGAEVAGGGGAKGGIMAALGAKGFLALGAAILLIGAGIGIASLGLAELASSFKDLGDNGTPAAIAIGLVTAGIVAMVAILAGLATSGIGEITVGILLAIGGALTLIGVGVTIASAGLSILVNSISGLLDSSTKLVSALTGLDDDIISNYITLIPTFSMLAKAINEIDVDILKELNKAATGTVKLAGTATAIAGPSTAMAGPGGGMSNATTTQEKQQVINLNITIDSPVQLDKQPMGRLVADISKQVVDGTLNEARRAEG